MVFDGLCFLNSALNFWSLNFASVPGRADAEEKRRFEQAQTNATVATVPRDLYISVYGSVVVAGFALTLVAVCLFYHVAVTASKSLHNAMFKRVLRAPIYFFDTNPIGESTAVVSTL